MVIDGIGPPNQNERDNQMTNHTYNGIEVDTSKLPEASINALLSRGLTHYLGSEQASKVTAKVAAFEKEHGEAPAEDEKAAWKAQFIADAVKALQDGTIGTRTGGPRLDPLAKAIRDIAGEEVTALIRNAGHKVPKGKETVSVRGEEVTFGQLVDRRLANPEHAERIGKAAKARVAEAAKRLANVGSLDDL